MHACNMYRDRVTVRGGEMGGGGADSCHIAKASPCVFESCGERSLLSLILMVSEQLDLSLCSITELWEEAFFL